jgi:GDPmannose 4,6-dehydratase
MVKFFMAYLLIILIFLRSLSQQQKALIIGINGQDGYYLKKLLKSKNYSVIGVSRKSDPENNVISCNYEDIEAVLGILEREKPDEIYNLAAISSVVKCTESPIEAFKANVLIPITFLEAIKRSSLKNSVKFFHASSSEIFGSCPADEPQTEKTPFNPDTIYGITKLAAHKTVNAYRAQGIFAVNGILYNHESIMRPPNFVSKKIVNAVDKIIKGEQEFLTVGNIDVYRDWSHAEDIVNGMHLSLQAAIATDYIFASGEKHTVREFIEKAFLHKGIKIVWQGNGLDEVGIDDLSKKVFVKIDPIYFRESEKNRKNDFCGNYLKALTILGWNKKYSFTEAIKKMS